ncbi:MAG TPA: matrixin family metalloprotease [Gemmataceae bacterium]
MRQQSSVRLGVECLEDRTTPATFGSPWPDSAHLTLSFAPDGTDVAGHTSRLAEHLGAGLPESVWKTEILRAFQTWAVHGNINIGVVADAGAPFGAPGPVQASPHHGDIRIGATSLSPDELAVSTPFDWFSSWAGDVLLNTSYRFGAGGSPGGPDLFTAVLHEAGHVLGLPHSGDPASPLYETYQGPRTGLTAGDIASLRELYDPRPHDGFDALLRNDSSLTASLLSFVRDGDETGKVARGDLTTGGDVDFYRIVAPWGAGSFTVALRTSGVSLLTPRVTVYDIFMRKIGSAVSTDPQRGDLQIRLRNSGFLGTYYVKVEAARGDVFGIGSYLLAVGSDEAAEAVRATSGSICNPENSSGDLTGTVAGLVQSVTRLDAKWDVSLQSRIDHAGDRDLFVVTALGQFTGGTMVVTAWSLDGGVRPKVTVRDALGRVVDAEVVKVGGGQYTIQVEGVGWLDTFTVEVERGAGSAAEAGNYFLGVNFREDPVEIIPFAEGVLDAANARDVRRLDSARAQLFHFNLDADALAPGVTTPVRVRLIDSAGRTVLRLQAAPGATAGADVVLAPGTYWAIIEPGPGVAGPLAYALRGAVRSDPIGPQPSDPTEEPIGGPTGGGSGTNTGGDSGDPYYYHYYYYWWWWGGVGTQDPAPGTYPEPEPEEDEDYWYVDPYSEPMGGY